MVLSHNLQAQNVDDKKLKMLIISLLYFLFILRRKKNRFLM